MKIKSSTNEEIIIDSGKGFEIKLSKSAMNYLTKDKDDNVVLDFVPSTINVYKECLGESVHLYCLSNVKVENVLDNKMITGYKDGQVSSAPVLINFDNCKYFESDRFDCVNPVWNLIIK